MTGAGKQIDSQKLFNQQKDCKDYRPGLKVIIDDIKSQDNLASIFRVADAAGCNHIILQSDCEITKSKQFTRIARSTEKFINLELLSKTDFINSVNEYKPLVAVEITTESENIFDSVLPAECAFVIGNEQNGISHELLEACQQAVHIPMFGHNGSMNVSHALAIALFEWRRQQAI